MDHSSEPSPADETGGTSGRTTTPQVTVEASRFDDRPHLKGYPGVRGVMIDATRKVTRPHVYTFSFPTVWILDSGEVQLDQVGRWPAADFLAWIDAIRPHLLSAQAEDQPDR